MISILMNVMNVFLKSHYRYLSNQRKSFLRFPVTLWKFRVFFYFRTFDSRVEIDAIHIGKIAISIASCLFFRPRPNFSLLRTKCFLCTLRRKNLKTHRSTKTEQLEYTLDHMKIVTSLFLSTLKRKAGVFKFLLFEGYFPIKSSVSM